MKKLLTLITILTVCLSSCSANTDTLTESEISLAGAVDNLINFKGGYVSHEHNVLGVLFTAIGISIFGNSPFGLRIVGFLFFLATLYLLFFFLVITSP